MKRFFMALAAVAAFAGCSKSVEPAVDMNEVVEINLSASIAEDDTRVSISGEKFTDVSWESGDVIRVWSNKGTEANLTAQSAGKSNVHFKGTAEAVADVDTYYGVHPQSAIMYGTVTVGDNYIDVNYAEQSGGVDSNAVLLAGMATEVSPYDINMEFKPVNALLHVSATGVATIAKAELMSLDGAQIPASYRYSYESNTCEHLDNMVSSIVVNNPSSSEFFISLPANLDLAGGYVVRLTDGSGNTCSKAYAGKQFVQGTTSRVAFEWSTPTVTLGAKTSYSYYAAGDAASANKCANNAIYFVSGINDEPCSSSYAGVQDAMISDVGYRLGSVDYTYSAGQISWDKSNNTFVFNEQPTYNVLWGEQNDVRAFIIVDGKRYYSSNNLWITGLPYSYDFEDGSLDKYRTDGWKDNGTLNMTSRTGVARTSTLVLQTKRWGVKESGFIVSPRFYMPSNINVQASIHAGQISWDKSNNTFVFNEQPTYNVLWGEQNDVRAFIIVDGKRYYSSNNLWITGLPYSYDFEDGSLDKYRTDGWKDNGTLNMTSRTGVARTSTLVLQTKRWGVKESGFIVSPRFYMPSNINVQASIHRSAYFLYWGGKKTRTGYVGAVANDTTSNTSSVTYTCSGGEDIGGTIYGSGEWLTAFAISPSTPYISIDSDEGDFSSTAHHYFLHEAHFRYAQ